MTKTTSKIICGIFIILHFVIVCRVAAQAENTEEQKIEPEITAIPAPEIASKTEETNSFLNKSRNLLAFSSGITEIMEQHKIYLERLADINIYSDPKKLQILSVGELSDIKQQSLRHKSQLGDWITRLSTQTKKIEQEARIIKHWTAIWQKTNESALEQKLPRDVLETIKSNINLLVKEDQELSLRIKKLLTIQNRISAQDILLSGIITEIEKLENLKRENLLVIDSEPLWQLMGAWNTQPHPIQQLRSMLKSHLRSLIDFYRHSAEGMTFQIFTFLVILILLILASTLMALGPGRPKVSATC